MKESLWNYFGKHLSCYMKEMNLLIELFFDLLKFVY